MTTMLMVVVAASTLLHAFASTCQDEVKFQEMKLSRAQLVTNYIAGFRKGSGCCNKQANALGVNDREICLSLLSVDENIISKVSITDKFCPKDFIKAQPSTGEPGVYWCNANCKAKIKEYRTSLLVDKNQRISHISPR